MRDQERRDLIAGALADLEMVRDRVIDAARRLDTLKADQFSGRSQMVSDVHQARGVHDPVADVVVAKVDAGVGENQFVKDRRKLDVEIGGLAMAARRTLKLVLAYTETSSTAHVPECVLCAALGRSRDVYGDQRCRWHYDFRQDWEINGKPVDAHPELGRMHLDRPRRYVTDSLIRQWMPGIKARVK